MVSEFRVFAGVAEGRVRELLAIARRRTFRRGEVVFHQGDLGEALHLVRRGRFAVRMTTTLGDATMLNVLGPGDSFGELSLLSGVPEAHSAGVEALEPAETLCVAASDFQRLRQDSPHVWETLARMLGERVRSLSRSLLIAHYLDAESRIRAVLVDLTHVYDDGGASCVIPLRQEQIAELSGTARATVNRVLRDEQTRGTLTLARGTVIVTDPEAIGRRVRGVR